MWLVILAFASWQMHPLTPTAQYAAPVYFCETIMSGSIALALSLYVRPAIAVALTFFGSSDWVSSKGWLYYLLPGDDRFGLAKQILNGNVPHWFDVGMALLYAFNVTAVAFAVALLRLRRLEV
jgi:hypothetical protein